MIFVSATHSLFLNGFNFLLNIFLYQGSFFYFPSGISLLTSIGVVTLRPWIIFLFISVIIVKLVNFYSKHISNWSLCPPVILSFMMPIWFSFSSWWGSWSHGEFLLTGGSFAFGIVLNSPLHVIRHFNLWTMPAFPQQTGTSATLSLGLPKFTIILLCF